MQSRKPPRPFLPLQFTLAALLLSVGGAEAGRAQVIEGDGWTLRKIPSRSAKAVQGGSGSNPFEGDTYSLIHQTGAEIDGQFRCFSEHLSGMDDNTVVFDGLIESLDPYLDGTQPQLLEFETTPSGQDSTEITINSFLDSGTDLFPEGFTDPKTGTPLTDACVEIGIDDTLDSSTSTTVSSATLQFFGNPGTTPIDITSFFSDPWDGRLSVVLSPFAGNETTGVVLQLQTEPDPMIFADGFESGDTSSWTDSVP